MKLTLMLLLVAVLAVSLPLVGCKKENPPPTTPTMNATPEENAPAANVMPETTAPATTTPAKTPTTGPA